MQVQPRNSDCEGRAKRRRTKSKNFSEFALRQLTTTNPDLALRSKRIRDVVEPAKTSRSFVRPDILEKANSADFAELGEMETTFKGLCDALETDTNRTYGRDISALKSEWNLAKKRAPAGPRPA